MSVYWSKFYKVNAKSKTFTTHLHHELLLITCSLSFYEFVGDFIKTQYIQKNMHKIFLNYCILCDRPLPPSKVNEMILCQNFRKASSPYTSQTIHLFSTCLNHYVGLIILEPAL